MQRFAIAITVLTMSAMVNSLTLPDKNTLANAFGDYQAKFAKKYDTSDELSYRNGLYQANMEEIKAFNAANNDWKKAENQFTDMTAEERAAYTGLKVPAIKVQNTASTDAEKAIPAFSGVTGTTTAATATKPTTAAATTVKATVLVPGNNLAAPFNALKVSVNWVTAGVVTPVKNQGQCGSCYAFSTIGLLESLYKQKFKTDINLSEQEMVDCSGNGGCGGGNMYTTLNYIKTSGIHLETADPYKAVVSSKCPYTADSYKTGAAATAAMSTAGSATTVLKVASLTEVGNKSLFSLLNALQTSPVTVAINVVNSLYSYSSGLYPAASCGTPVQDNINHAVLAVGYSITGDSTSNNKPYILIKNSWGNTWGEAGYFKLEIPSWTDVGLGPCNITNGGMNYVATLL